MTLKTITIVLGLMVVDMVVDCKKNNKRIILQLSIEKLLRWLHKDPICQGPFLIFNFNFYIIYHCF